MRVVPTHADAIVVSAERGAGVARVLVVEGNVVVYELANGGDPLSDRRRVAEQLPRDVGELFRFAVTAG